MMDLSCFLGYPPYLVHQSRLWAGEYRLMARSVLRSSWRAWEHSRFCGIGYRQANSCSKEGFSSATMQDHHIG